MPRLTRLPNCPFQMNCACPAQGMAASNPLNRRANVQRARSPNDRFPQDKMPHTADTSNTHTCARQITRHRYFQNLALEKWHSKIAPKMSCIFCINEALAASVPPDACACLVARNTPGIPARIPRIWYTYPCTGAMPTVHPGSRGQTDPIRQCAAYTCPPGPMECIFFLVLFYLAFPIF